MFIEGSSRVDDTLLLDEEMETLIETLNPCYSAVMLVIWVPFVYNRYWAYLITTDMFYLNCFKGHFPVKSGMMTMETTVKGYVELKRSKTADLEDLKELQAISDEVE